jgi:hypothetical protein
MSYLDRSGEGPIVLRVMFHRTRTDCDAALHFGNTAIGAGCDAFLANSRYSHPAIATAFRGDGSVMTSGGPSCSGQISQPHDHNQR